MTDSKSIPVPAHESLVRPLEGDTFDIIGDVHGECDLLRELVGRLGYRKDGEHPEGRKLILMGDLCDRGPKSPEVVSFVRTLVRAGRAECILGNHELNILRWKEKEGNGWIVPRKEGGKETHDQHKVLMPQKCANEDQRAEFLEFFRSLPLALEGSKLRVVHACWDDTSIASARTHRDVLALYESDHARTREILLKSGVDTRDAAEYGLVLDKPDAMPEFPDDLIRVELANQNGNAAKVLTSGPEVRAAKPFFAGGKWRATARHAWWNSYAASPFLVVGHYWRGAEQGDELFVGVAREQTLGPNGNVMCIDFGVGNRYKERAANQPHRSALAAMRWPEMTTDAANAVVVVGDNG